MYYNAESVHFPPVICGDKMQKNALHCEMQYGKMFFIVRYIAENCFSLLDTMRKNFLHCGYNAENFSSLWETMWKNVLHCVIESGKTFFIVRCNTETCSSLWETLQ